MQINNVKFEKAFKQLKKYKSYPVVLSIRQYKLFSLLINFSALLKGRKAWSHSSYAYFRDGELWEYDMTLARNASTRPLKYHYFDERFKGRVVAHIFPDKKIKKEEFNWGKTYSTKRAVFGWLSFTKQKDSVNKGYCSDEVLDIVENCTGVEYLKNNAKSTPASLYEYAEKRGFKKIIIN